MNAKHQNDVRSQVSAEEWQVRVDLAACYRLVALYGWDDIVFTHISARVPGPEHHFLINPYGMMFEEITASSLVKVDEHCAKVLDSPYPVNPAGFVIHSAIHFGRACSACCAPIRRMAWRSRHRKAACCRSRSRRRSRSPRSVTTTTKASRSTTPRKRAS